MNKRYLSFRIGVPPVNGKEHEILSFETCAIFKEYLPIFPRFLFWKNRDEEITNKRIKIIPSNIDEMLTARGIAYWFMDDGCYYSSSKIMFCTQAFTTYNPTAWGFTLEENNLLSKVLQKKFSLDCSVIQVKQPKKENQFWYPLIVKKNKKLTELLELYLLPSFNYKLSGSPRGE
jgi:hypothetical protein